MPDPVAETKVDPLAFRRALGNFATGVTIITACGPDGEKVGVTANSFNSLSMDPPLILWSSMKEAKSNTIFESASHFAVNILASEQIDLSNHFARQQVDKFAGVPWEAGIGGAPLFSGCSGRFQCEAYDKLDGGDHWIFIGKVVAFDDFGRAPLCFHQGSYSMIFAHPETSKCAEADPLHARSGGKVENHKFFLMLRAVQAYQARYQPKIQTLGLNVVEARALLIMTDFPALKTDQLIMQLNVPIDEVDDALRSLSDRDLVRYNGSVYEMTDAGHAKAKRCWDVAGAHAEEAFGKFSEAQLESFTTVLQSLI
ncbi:MULTISPECIES: p-hydroxyphenylacetate 3-hydroxylase reductase component [Alphaproteobacteria]|uniref:p-hydroxyphenylacetate 3-hydroxylase reductase component n=1 Tax=Alphaproteobacteria TaxID=28211 RepID=UPI003A90DA1C